MELDQSETKEPLPTCDITVEECDVDDFITGILHDICDRVAEDESTIENNVINLLRNQRDRKDFHRKTFVFDDSSFSDNEENLDENCNLTLKSKSAEIISTSHPFDEEEENCYHEEEEEENSPVETVNTHLVVPKLMTSKSSDSIRQNLNVTPRREKKLSFSSFFKKKDKHKDHKDNKMEHETYDDFDPLQNLSSLPSKSLLKSRRYSSVSDITKSSTLQRTPSFVKRKLASLQSETKTLIRSLSFRDLSKKKEKEKLAEMKNIQWKSSLQKLVENDTHVSYKDLSFVNYDELNTLSYISVPKKEAGIHRTQSMVEKGTKNNNKDRLLRGTSVGSRISLQSGIAEQSGALSLPSLHHLNQNRENVDQDQQIDEQGVSPKNKYRRRPQSISSEDGKSRPNGSFRTAGSGCAKLKRHNACRQKARDVTQLEGRNYNREGQTARFDLFKKEKSRDDSSEATKEIKAETSSQSKLRRQKSIEGSTSRTGDYFKALSFRDKTKSASVKNVDVISSSKQQQQQQQQHLASTSSFISTSSKGVRKSDKIKDSEKSHKISFKSSGGKTKGTTNTKAREGVNKDDFLKATMRIFLVVSPPVGKIQVRSRSLNHLDTLEMRQASACAADAAALKDSRSEPDCTRAQPPGTVQSQAVSYATEASAGKRHMLSRSQKSSSECFSVNFEVGDEATWETELFFPASHGITLFDSLCKLCELRNIDLSSCDIWLTDRESNTHAWLPLTQDTGCLVGRHIRITAKDASNKKGSISLGNHSRKPSGSSRQRTSSFFSSSTEDPTTGSNLNLTLLDADVGKKQTKQPRWSAFFSNNKDTKMENLIEQLNSYSKFGISKCQDHPDYPQGQCASIDALYKLEEDWTTIIDINDMPERLQQQQTALWELIKTEVAYIRTLKVVTDLFLACLKNLQSVNILKEIDTEKLFSNITEILASNVCFWRNTLFPLVRDMRTYKQPPCIESMCEGFSKMRDTFQAYFKYCADQSRCQHYCRDIFAHNELFTAYLAWCETQKECNRLRLMDILVQPMQRLTKYGLLLKAILKNTDDDVERESLSSMIKMVDDFVNSVNHSLKQKQDNERLKGIIARIESYDVVESKDEDLEKLLKSYSILDLNRPMLNCPPERKRHLLLEGDLKLKDSSTSKMEVHCFLLTDMLLICKPSTKKGGATVRVIRQPYLVDRLVVTELTRETPSLAVVYKNEFDMAIAAFILQNNDSKKLKSWKDGIVKAQTLYSQAKQLSYMTEESVDTDYSFDYNLDGDYHSLQLAPRSPLASSSRASRVSSLAHSHSGSVEMNDQSSIGSAKEQSRAVSMENDNRTTSISSDEGVQPLPPDKTPVSQKSSFKYRIFNKTPNTLSVQPLGNLGQSLPNLVSLGSPNMGTLNLNLNQNTLSVPKNGGHLLSPTSRGISYPPPSPTRGNLRRGLAISQSKNPPLIKTRHVNSTTACTSGQPPTSFDFDVPVIAAVPPPGEDCDTFSRGQHRQAMLKRIHRNDNKRYHTAGAVDDLKRDDKNNASIHKRLSWNCTTHDQQMAPDEKET